MINYPRNVIFIVYFLSSNLFTERFHSTAIIPQPCLRSNCNPINIIPTPSLAFKCVSLKKTYILFHCNYNWIIRSQTCGRCCNFQSTLYSPSSLKVGAQTLKEVIRLEAKNLPSFPVLSLKGFKCFALPPPPPSISRRGFWSDKKEADGRRLSARQMVVRFSN